MCKIFIHCDWDDSILTRENHVLITRTIWRVTTAWKRGRRVHHDVSQPTGSDIGDLPIKLRLNAGVSCKVRASSTFHHSIRNDAANRYLILCLTPTIPAITSLSHVTDLLDRNMFLHDRLDRVSCAKTFLFFLLRYLHHFSYLFMLYVRLWLSHHWFNIW